MLNFNNTINNIIKEIIIKEFPSININYDNYYVTKGYNCDYQFAKSLHYQKRYQNILTNY